MYLLYHTFYRWESYLFYRAGRQTVLCIILVAEIFSIIFGCFFHSGSASNGGGENKITAFNFSKQTKRIFFARLLLFERHSEIYEKLWDNWLQKINCWKYICFAFLFLRLAFCCFLVLLLFKRASLGDLQFDEMCTFNVQNI